MIRIGTLAVAILLAQTPVAKALDCAKATSPFDKSLCADPEARAMDARMSKAYSALWAVMDAEERKGLLENQRYWLKYREHHCPVADRGLTYCIKLNTKIRADLLEKYARWTEGIPSIRPLFWTKYSFIDKYSLVYITPIIRSKNKNKDYFFKKSIDAEYNGKDASVEHYMNADRGAFSYREIEYEILYKSSKVVSIRWENSEYTGGAHGHWGQHGIIIDLESSKVYRPQEVFDISDKMISELTKECRSYGKKKKSIIKDIYLSYLRESIGYFDSNWFIVKGGMQLRLPMRFDASYKGGMPECFILNRVLMKYLRPGVTLIE